MAVSTPKSLPAKIEPKSHHVSDPNLQPFLQPDFDPADYLNTTLPPLSISSTTSSRTSNRSVPLSEVSSQLQSLLSQLNAQTSRLSNTLTQLTDEIIRSGSRLAYEVEVLRGETNTLTDTFENGLKKDVELFVPEKSNAAKEARDDANGDTVEEKAAASSQEPEFLERLRTLTTVRERLDQVIKIFGSAMQWTLAPSELSVASSFISVSAPDNDDTRSREEKGKEFTEKLRSEINDLLTSGAEGLETANLRVDEMRTLAELWKGTTEEKARYKLVESLQKLVDDKQKALDKAADSRRPGVSPARGYDYRYGNMEIPKAPTPSQTQPEGGSGYGFLQNLKNLRNEMYMD